MLRSARGRARPPRRRARGRRRSRRSSSPERDPLGVAAEQDDPVRAETLRRRSRRTARPRRRRRPRRSCPGRPSPRRAAWWPVPITSVSVSSDGISASSAPTGSTTSVPSACGTRTASPWPPSTSSQAVPATVQARALQPFAAEDAGAVRPEKRRDDEVAGLDRRDVGADRLDDADELVAHPAAGRRSCSIDLYGHRSLPQIAAQVIRTSASADSINRASGTFSTRTSPAPYMTVARIGSCLQVR